MKSLFVLGFVILCCVATFSEAQDPTSLIPERCLRDFGATMEEIGDLMSGKTANADVSDELKCTLHCWMVEIGFMDETGKIDTVSIKKMFPDVKPKEMQEFVEACGNNDGVANACERAFKLLTCMDEKNITFNIDIN